jgi:hypothetical protein
LNFFAINFTMQGEFSTAFPLPPRYYKLYTDENLKIWNETENKSILNFDLAPPTVISGTYTVFGQTLSTSTEDKSFKTFGVKMIQTILDKKEELKVLVDSLMATFLELL